MKLILQTLIFSFLALTIVSCDEDDSEDMMTTVCTKAVTFEVDGTEVCATGTFTLGAGSSTTLNLVGDDAETLVIGVQGSALTAYAIPAGNAIYTAADGTVYSSTSGGLLTVTDNTTTLDATFSFDAATANGDAVSITAGVVSDLPSR